MTGPRFDAPDQRSRKAPAPVPDKGAARAVSAGAGLPGDVVCPACGTTSVVDGVRRKEHDFCVACDYPLFWAAPRRTTLPPETLGDERLRQLPAEEHRPQAPAVVPLPWWQVDRLTWLVGLSALFVLVLDLVALVA